MHNVSFVLSLAARGWREGFRVRSNSSPLLPSTCSHPIFCCCCCLLLLQAKTTLHHRVWRSELWGCWVFLVV